MPRKPSRGNQAANPKNNERKCTLFHSLRFVWYAHNNNFFSSWKFIMKINTLGGSKRASSSGCQWIIISYWIEPLNGWRKRDIFEHVRRRWTHVFICVYTNIFIWTATIFIIILYYRFPCEDGMNICVEGNRFENWIFFFLFFCWGATNWPEGQK